MILEDEIEVVSPYETFGLHSTRHVSNFETPELYSMHPFRYLLGRSLQTGARRRDIAPSIFCLENSGRETWTETSGGTRGS